jgi:hypothetical protein
MSDKTLSPLLMKVRKAVLARGPSGIKGLFLKEYKIKFCIHKYFLKNKFSNYKSTQPYMERIR